MAQAPLQPMYICIQRDSGETGSFKIKSTLTLQPKAPNAEQLSEAIQVQSDYDPFLHHSFGEWDGL